MTNRGVRASRHGKHASPRRQLLASPGQWAAWDAAAKREEKTFSEWARAALDAAARRARSRTKEAQ